MLAMITWVRPYLWPMETVTGNRLPDLAWGAPGRRHPGLGVSGSPVRSACDGLVVVPVPEPPRRGQALHRLPPRLPFLAPPAHGDRHRPGPGRRGRLRGLPGAAPQPRLTPAPDAQRPRDGGPHPGPPPHPRLRWGSPGRHTPPPGSTVPLSFTSSRRHQLIQTPLRSSLNAARCAPHPRREPLSPLLAPTARSTLPRHSRRARGPFARNNRDMSQQPAEVPVQHPAPAQPSVGSSPPTGPGPSPPRLPTLSPTSTPTWTLRRGQRPGPATSCPGPVPGPRAQLAGVQRAGAGTRRGPERPAARAGQLPGDLRVATWTSSSWSGSPASSAASPPASPPAPPPACSRARCSTRSGPAPAS